MTHLEGYGEENSLTPSKRSCAHLCFTCEQLGKVKDGNESTTKMKKGVIVCCVVVWCVVERLIVASFLNTVKDIAEMVVCSLSPYSQECVAQLNALWRA